MNNIISRTFVLKKAVVTGDSHSLCDLVRLSVGKLNKAKDRQSEPETGEERIRLLNDWRFLGVSGEVCVASFFSFTMNEDKNAVVINNDQESYPIEILAPKRSAEHHQEFVAGLSWIAVKDNYIAVMTSQTFAFTALEEYLSWLFSRALDKTISILFTDPSNPKYRDCDMSSVKCLEINNDIGVKAQVRASDSNAVLRRHFVPTGRGWAVLKAIYNAMGLKLPKMGATNEHAFDKIDVNVTIKARRPTIADGNQADALERIANAFKDVENPPIKAIFKDGRMVSLSDYRVSKRYSIAAKNGIPVVADVCGKLDAWLRDQIQLIESAAIGQERMTGL